MGFFTPWAIFSITFNIHNIQVKYMKVRERTVVSLGICRGVWWTGIRQQCSSFVSKNFWSLQLCFLLLLFGYGACLGFFFVLHSNEIRMFNILKIIWSHLSLAFWNIFFSENHQIISMIYIYIWGDLGIYKLWLSPS